MHGTGGSRRSRTLLLLLLQGRRLSWETVASAEDAAGETMDQVRPRKARKSWTRRNVLKPNVTRKASRSVKRSAKEERNQRVQRNQRDAAAEKAAGKAARKGGVRSKGAVPMTPAERVKAYRERKRAEASKGGKGGGKTRRGRKG